MNTSPPVPLSKAEFRKQQTANALEHHKDAFKYHGIEKPFFDIKAINTNPIGEKIVNFFPTQMSKGVDIYLEITDYNWNFTDPKRKLYKFRANENYQDEYEYVTTPAGEQYSVPFDELEVVTYNPTVLEAQKKAENNLDNLMLEKVTFRDVACVLLKIPKTNHSWLNELIKEASK